MEFLAWPAVALILGLVAIFVFRQPFSRFLDRAKKIGKGGIEAGTGSQTTGRDVKPFLSTELTTVFDNTLLMQRENFIRIELDRLSITSGSERERALIHLLAAVSLVHKFEQTYTLIWGSQIAALQFLNSAGGDGMQAEFLRPWYDQAAAREAELYQSYSFDQWLEFLRKSQLILKTGEKITITLEGREFLKYLLHQGHSLYKRG